MDSGVMVTMPVSGRGDLGFKSHPGRISLGHQVVYIGVEVSWWQISYFYIVVVNKCTNILGHWNL